jgi:hypothetical protein
VSGDPYRLKSAPRHRNVTYQQGTVEDRTAWGKPVQVIEEAGTNGVNLDGLGAPEVGAKFHAVESLPIAGDGESRTAAPEEVGCLPQGGKQLR